MKTTIAIFLTAMLAACNAQQRARTFGGTAEESLPPGQKLVTMTWKGNELWLLYRPMRSDEKPETYTFHESSSFGILQGDVIVHERR